MLTRKVTAAARTLALPRAAPLLKRAILYAVVAIASVIFMFPFVWALLSSGKDSSEIYSFPPTFWPSEPLFVKNYTLVWTVTPFGRWMFNSAFIATIALIGMVISASLTAYSFARFKFPGRDAIFLVTLATMMLPAEVTLIPSYRIFQMLGWIDTYNPLIVPFWLGGGAFNIFLMRQFFMSIPLDLDEAAEMDGANSWQIFWHIMMPLAKPAIATMATLGFIFHWNNFLAPLIYINSGEKFPAVLGLSYFVSGQYTSGVSLTTNWTPTENLLMAASIVVALPALILFFVAQKYFVQGIITTGIKG